MWTTREILMACMAYPLLEELVFRWGLLGELDRVWAHAKWRNNVLSSLLFGLCHWPIWGAGQALAVVLPSLLLGNTYQRTGRLWLVVALHAAMNALGNAVFSAAPAFF